MKNKDIRILHVSEIDNDLSKGTSVIIPQYIISQKKLISRVGILNCNDISLIKLASETDVFSLSDNKEMAVFKEFKPSIVIFHEVYKVYYLTLYKYCLKNNIPYVIIPHGCLTEKAQNHKKIKKIIGNLFFFNKFIKNASAIQYLSENECLISKFRNVNSYVLGNGINDIPTQNLYLSQKHCADCTTIVYVGRYDFLIKGLDQLILACSLIKDEMIKKKIKLILYGIGDSKNNELILNMIEEHDLNHVISFNGPIYNEEKREIIAKSDVFIQVSRTEGQPLGIMEAMALGMPLIVSNGTSFGEIVGDNCGFVVETEAKEISAAILEIASCDDLKKYSKIAYEYAKNNFSWKMISLNAIDKYKNIVKGD